MPDTPSDDHGLFHLYPDPINIAQCAVDIIAIHGLGGNAFKTWTDSTGHMWLRDSLPDHVPNARIMTYGYDSAVAFGRSRMDVGDFAIDLLTRLIMERQSPAEQSRPLIFICHSLGGVVLKQALITASAVRPYYGVIRDRTFGIVFMGTPHRGSRAANQARYLGRIINITSMSSMVRSDLLGVLSMSSKALQNISQLSVPVLKDLVIVSFYEQKPLGPTLIVESVSAILGLPNERAIPINADHRKIAKVSPAQKHLYMPVYKAVVELVDASVNENTAQLKALMDIIYTVDYKRTQLLQRQPHNGTCDWIFERRGFNAWATADTSSFLWLVGRAGVGKSVLTRYIVEEVVGGNDRQLFPQDYLGASFFCSYKDTAGHAEEDVLRSILHQLLHICPQIQGTVRKGLDIYPSTKRTDKVHRSKLWTTIEDVLTLDAMQNCFICIDALEELPIEAQDNLFHGLHGLVARFARTLPKHRLRVFVSSRPLPELEKTFKAGHIVRMQPADVSPNIGRYLRDSVAEFAEKNESFGNAADRELRREIANKIIQRADGMFLYANIAWEDFKWGLLWNRSIIRQKLRALDSTAPGINTLYDRMMNKVDPNIQSDMWSIFGAIAVAGRPLSEAELGIILAIKYSNSTEEIICSDDIHPFQELADIVEDNFPELVRIQDDGTLTFAHLSFKEYLLNYWAEKDPNWLEKAHRTFADACIVYLELQDILDRIDGADSLDAIAMKYPFFEYAYNYHVDHIGNINYNDRIWLRYANIAGPGSVFTVRWHWKAYESPLLAVAGRFKSVELIKRFAAHGYDMNEPWRPVSAPSALGYCCENLKDSRDIIIALLDAGANPNDTLLLTFNGRQSCIQHLINTGDWQTYEKFVNHPNINLDVCDWRNWTTLHYMVQYGDLHHLREFLDRGGFDVNAQDVRGDTAIHQASTYEELDKLKLLLNTEGVRLDIQDKQGRTPITVASFWGHRKAALMLISHSKALPTPDENEMSSIICAAKQDDHYLTQRLLEKYGFRDLGHHLDASARTVLHHAAMNDWPDIIDQILNHSENESLIDCIDFSGSSALHHAAWLGHTRCAKILLDHHASLRLQDRNGRTAAHAAADGGFKDTLVLLLDGHDIDASQRDHQGRNLAHWAASIDCVDVMETIVTRWPDVDLMQKDNLLQLPVDIAQVCQCANVGRFLTQEMARRGVGAWVRHTYHWDTMYNTPLLEYVEEEDLADTYRQVRILYEATEQQARWAEWEALKKEYPEEDWALVLRHRDHMLLDLQMIGSLADEAERNVEAACLPIRDSDSAVDVAFLRAEIAVARDELDDIDNELYSTMGALPRQRLRMIQVRLNFIRGRLDIILLVGRYATTDVGCRFDEILQKYREIQGMEREYLSSRYESLRSRDEALDEMLKLKRRVGEMANATSRSRRKR